MCQTWSETPKTSFLTSRLVWEIQRQTDRTAQLLSNSHGVSTKAQLPNFHNSSQPWWWLSPVCVNRGLETNKTSFVTTWLKKVLHTDDRPKKKRIFTLVVKSVLISDLPYTYLIAIYLCYPFKIWTPLPVLGRDDQNRYGVCVNSHRKPDMHEIFVSELN